MEVDKESQKAILPKDIFRSRFTWFCYEIYNCPLVWVPYICRLLGFGIYGWLYRDCYKDASVSVVTDGPNLVILLSSFILELVTCYYWFFYRFRNTTELLQQVIELNPGLDIENWELISNNINGIFYEKAFWRTPYFFFDGQDAQRIFRENVIKLYLKEKFNDDNINEIKSSRIYLQSVKETLRFNLKDNLPELTSELELPRDAHKSRYFSNLGYQSMALNCIIVLCLAKGFFQRKDLSFYLPLCLYISICLFVGSMRLIYPMMSISLGVKFLAVIVMLAPGQSLDKWDETARYMNQYLDDEEVQNSCRFFDGKHCFKFYKKYFESLLVENGPLEYGDLIEAVKLTQPYVD